MKVDYGEIIFQSTEGVTEDQGMVQFLSFWTFRDFVQFWFLGPSAVRYGPSVFPCTAFLPGSSSTDHFPISIYGRPVGRVFLPVRPRSMDQQTRTEAFGPCSEKHWRRIFWKLIPVNQIKVEIDLKVEYNRNTSNPKIEELLEEKWKQKTAENSRLYSQSKFRLHSLHRTGYHQRTDGLDHHRLKFSGWRVRGTLISLKKYGR